MVSRFITQLAGLAAGVALGVVGILVVTGTSLDVLRAQEPAAVDAPAAPLAVSQVLHYQARVLEPDTGEPKPDGGYVMSFSIYNAPSGGTPLWTESKTVQTSKGVFSTLLGDTTPLNLSIFTGQELYLGIAVGGDPEATPRQRLAHAAYAVRAENAGKAATADVATSAGNADQLDTLDATAFALAGHTHSGGDTKFLSLDPFGALLANPTTNTAYFSGGFGPNSGIRLPNSGNSSFYLGFTIPPDYSAGTTLVLRIVWHTPSVNCKIRFSPNAISVARPGRTHIVGATTGTGLSVVGGETLTAPGTANQSNETLVQIVSPASGVPLEPKDSINFSLFRRADDATDTCTDDMAIQSFSITYQ